MRKVFYSSVMAHMLLWRKGFKTAMFFGFICTKRRQVEPLPVESVNHEAIHVEQYMEITAIAILIAVALSFAFGWAAWPFILAITLYYVIYFIEVGISWVHNFFAHQKKDAGASADKAYYNSMFEMEAYAHEKNVDYIASRQPFCWIHYFGKI